MLEKVSKKLEQYLAVQGLVLHAYFSLMKCVLYSIIQLLVFFAVLLYLLYFSFQFLCIKYESEQEVRTVFSRARTCSPCIIFFDEIDALTVDRRREGESVVGRVLLQLLSELDGGAQRHGVYVIAATNRPEVIDPAFLRTGRLGIHCYVPLPSADERVLILKALTSKMPVSPDLDYNAIAYAEACSNFSGADLAGLVKKAAMFVKEQMLMDQGILYNKSLVIKTSHFEKALEKIVPSVSKERRLHYENLSKNFGAS